MSKPLFAITIVSIEGKSPALVKEGGLECWDEDYFIQLYDLIREHMRKVPPYLEIDNSEIKAILNAPDHLENLRPDHNDKGSEPDENAIFITLENNEVLAATQIYFEDSSDIA